MPRILLLYATIEGQTALIADRMALTLRNLGHGVDLLSAQTAGEALDPGRYDGVIIAASIHYENHPRYLRALVRKHLSAIATRPSAFFSVSLSAGGRNPNLKEARRNRDRFLRQTGWQPELTETIAGALKWSLYGPFKRLAMLFFVKLVGGDTDRSRDYEYTDWTQVERLASDFADLLKPKV
ncbi:MAG: protoporphyrinogen oxidase [Gammaproteobacteria bacterium]|nr:protoporphyrinogen oxidase [Gammaproteobacteria bacterium]